MKHGVKAAVVGLGLGQFHLDVYERDERIAEIAVCDTNESSLARARSGSRKVQDTYTDLKKLLAGFNPDLVSVTTPDHFHREHSIMCLEAGCDVLLTKPIAASLSDSEMIVAASKRSRGRLMVAHERRFRSYYSTVKSLIDTGRLGDIAHIRVESIQDKRWQIERSPWFGSPESGRTAVTGSGIHEVDLIKWLGGDKVVEIAAFGNNIGELDYYAPTTVSTLFRFANGTIGEFTISYQAHWPDRKMDNSHAFALIGSSGMVYGPRYSTDDSPGWNHFEFPADAVQEGSYACVDTFIDVILNDKPIPVTAEDAHESLELGVAVNRAVSTGTNQKIG